MAQWTSAFINDLPDSSFLYVEPGGSKDSEGKTTPRSLRHFPVKDASGNVDMPHLRNALARIPQSNLPAAVKARCTAKAQGMMPANRSSEVKTFWRAADYELDIERSAQGNPILHGVLLRFDEWNEIDSPMEGHFMERFSPSVFKKTLAERMDRIRVIFQHGRDALVGDKPIGRIKDMPNDGLMQRYQVELFRASYVDDLMPALEAGQFGSSFSARNINSETKARVKRSDYNPEGLPEVTRLELAMREFGPVTFPAIESATAEVGQMRSITDDHLQPAWMELLTALGWQPPVLRAATLEPEEEPEPEADPEAEAEPEAEPETTPPEDEPPHSAEEASQEKREEEPPSWQLIR